MAHLLIVDDEPDICWGLQRLTERLGHSAEVAADGEAALKSVAARPPDLILLDVRLPGRDGLEIMREIRSLHAKVPIAIMTAYGDLEIAVQAMRQGAFEYLVKPFDLAVVRRVIERALQPPAENADRVATDSPEAEGEFPIIGTSSPMQEVFRQIALVAPTDAAAVFAVLRGGRLRLQPRVGQTIEVESCANDPMAVILTLTLIDILAAREGSWVRIILSVPIQLAVGAGVGFAFGLGGRWLLSRVRIQATGLYPVLTISLAFIAFGVATLAHGSGFLAVFICAVVLGAGRIPNHAGLARVHDSLAWLSQVGMFLMLGLLVFPSQLLDVAWQGLGLALFLAFLGRPLAVLLCLLPFRYRADELTYIGWAGLRGAVPIVLATFPVLAEVRGALDVFNLVFFIVVASSIIPGSTLRYAARRLGLTVPERPTPAAVLEINSTYSLKGELVSFHIEPTVAVCDALLRDIEFPRGSAVVLIVRGRELIAPRGDTAIRAGDHVYMFFQPEDRPMMELLFGSPEAG